eukprot:910936_1
METIDNNKPKKDSPRPWSVVNNQQLIPNKYVMKWNEGMLKQCYHVGEYYREWVDHAKLRPVRMFDSDYIEAASFTPWWVVPGLYIPWALLELDLSYQDFKLNSNQLLTIFITQMCRCPLLLFSILLFINGTLLWTLFEYFVHKHGFHWVPPTYSWNVVHFIGHGMHHLTPADKYRLVFPPAVSFPIGLCMRFIFYYIFPFGIRSAMFGGFVLGYACYESIHFLSHHCPYGAYLQERFKQHSAHHFNPQKREKIFGVSTQIWDMVFDTM